jgi:hypothetical protein
MQQTRWILAILLLGGCPGELPDAPADRAVQDGWPWADPDGGGVISQQNTTSGACVAAADGETLALYTFDADHADQDGTVTDATGARDGKIVGSGVSYVDGRPGCGKAVAFSGEGYVEIPSTAALESLKEGSIDFWLRIDGDGQQGVLSRDAQHTNSPGHLSIMITKERRVRARLQSTSDEFIVDSDKIQDSGWHHVGVCFGSVKLELHVDGQLRDSETTSVGIAGNKNPLVLGGLSWTSPEGAADPVEYPLVGALDSVRISSARRDFSQ